MRREPGTSRRGFLLGSASLLAASAGCGLSSAPPRPATSPVALLPCADETPERVAEAVEACMALAPPPDPRGKVVLLKPNVVEHHPDRPIHSSPVVVEALARAFLARGAARVILGEGPGHRRDTEALFRRAGLAEVARRLSMELVDLNCDDLRPRETGKGEGSPLRRLWLPRRVVEADLVVSVAKMKTHHWVGATLSLKNLFGCLPGGKYGWPKNLLHWNPDGLADSIVTMARLAEPAWALVDGIVAMEGDGPLMGRPVSMGVLVAGADLVAVDCLCAWLMGLAPARLDWLQAAAAAGLGRASLDGLAVKGANLMAHRRSFDLLPHLAKLKG